MADFLDKMADSELADFSEQFYTKVNTEPTDYAATEAQAIDLKEAKNKFVADLTAHIAAQAAARSQTQAKDASRVALENVIRFIIRQAKLNEVADAMLADLGVSTEPEAPAASKATRPTGRIDTSQRLAHTIHSADEAAPDIKRRPRGTLGLEIYRKIGGAPPVDVSECTFLTLDTETPYYCEYSGADVGKMVHYMMRWRFRDESTSPWSETISATVTG